MILYLEEMGGKAFKNRKRNVTRALQWLESEPLVRPFAFKTMVQLRKQCSERFNRALKEFTSIKEASVLIDMLLGRTSDETANLMSDNVESLETQLLKQVIMSTFMGKLTGKRKEYAKGKSNSKSDLYNIIINSVFADALSSASYVSKLALSRESK